MDKSAKIISAQRMVVKTFSFKKNLQKKFQPILDSIREEDLQNGKVFLKNWMNKNVEPVKVNLCGKLSKPNSQENKTLARAAIIPNSVQNICFFGDSYLFKHKTFAQSRKVDLNSLTKHVNINPHKTSIKIIDSHIHVNELSIGQEVPTDTMFYRTIGKGGLTYEKALDEQFVRSWVNSNPRVTVLHLGACDVNNTSILIRIATQFNNDNEQSWRDFPHYVYHWIDRLIIVAKGIINKEQPNKMAEFLKGMLYPKIVFWGEFCLSFIVPLMKGRFSLISYPIVEAM